MGRRCRSGRSWRRQIVESFSQREAIVRDRVMRPWSLVHWFGRYAAASISGGCRRCSRAHGRPNRSSSKRKSGRSWSRIASAATAKRSIAAAATRFGCGDLLAGGESGPAIVPGEPEKSRLIEAINYRELEMPPDARLKAEQVQLLTEWVKSARPGPAAAPMRPCSRGRAAWLSPMLTGSIGRSGRLASRHHWQFRIQNSEFRMRSTVSFGSN